mmetsp:Transcript_7181/g.22661  ORF Transcript_7181/g.22661 Transcript_7181/m.22661 type:complete len:279 (-) Transcript_7181:312-1148(-)
MDRGFRHVRVRRFNVFERDVAHVGRRRGLPALGARGIRTAVVEVHQDAVAERRRALGRNAVEDDVPHVRPARRPGLDVRHRVGGKDVHVLNQNVLHSTRRLRPDGDARVAARTIDAAHRDVFGGLAVVQAEAVPARLDGHAIIATGIRRILDDHISRRVRIPPVRIRRVARRFDGHAAHVDVVAVVDVRVPERRVEKLHVVDADARRIHEFHEMPARHLQGVLLRPPIRAVAVQHRRRARAADRDVFQVLAVDQGREARAHVVAALAVRRRARNHGPG